MDIERLRDDLYEVQSRSSSARSYFVQHGKEGDFWSCTCTRWAITRNRAGGLGNRGTCAHVIEIEAKAECSRAQLVMARKLLAIKANL